MTEDGSGKPVISQEPIVLDREGHVLHDPTRGAGVHQKAQFKIVSFRSVGFIPKVILGTVFVALLILGLTFAGIALGVIFVGFLTRTIFRSKRR